METLDYDLQTVQEARNLARQAQKAEDVFCKFTNEQVDRILQNMVRVAEENAAKLARMAVEETGFGKVEDKIIKNQVASRDVYNYIKDMKTIGVIHEDTVNRITEIGEPVGVVLGIIPSTNPTSTVIYNAMIALKARNTIVFSPYPAGKPQFRHRIIAVCGNTHLSSQRKQWCCHLFVTVIGNIQLCDFVSFHCFQRLFGTNRLSGCTERFQAHETSLLKTYNWVARLALRHLDILSFPYFDVNVFFVK